MKAPKQLISIFAWISLCGLPTFGQSNLSLDDAVKLAQKNSEDVALKILGQEKLNHQYREVFGTALPQLSLSASWQNNLREPVAMGNRLNFKQQAQLGVNVSQTLWAFGRVGAALNAARSAIHIGQLEQRLTEKEVQMICEIAYYNVLYAERLKSISEQSLINAKKSLMLLERKFSRGRPPKGDYIRLKSDVESRKAQLWSAETQLNTARMTLGQIIGQTEDKAIQLTTAFNNQFNNFQLKALSSELNEHQPQLKLLKQYIEYNEQAAKIQNAASLPTLSAIGNYSYSAASADTLSRDQFLDSTYVGVALSWNLWDGGSSRAKYRQALSEKKIAEINLKKSEENLNLKLKQLVDKYHSLTQSYGPTKQATTLLKKSFQISQNRFGTGQSSITELNSTELALIQAEHNEANTIFEIHRTASEIKNLVSYNIGAQNEK